MFTNLILKKPAYKPTPIRIEAVDETLSPCFDLDPGWIISKTVSAYLVFFTKKIPYKSYKHPTTVRYDRINTSINTDNHFIALKCSKRNQKYMMDYFETDSEYKYSID